MAQGGTIAVMLCDRCNGCGHVYNTQWDTYYYWWYVWMCPVIACPECKGSRTISQTSSGGPFAEAEAEAEPE